jgi:hypothetical protein
MMGMVLEPEPGRYLVPYPSAPGLVLELVWLDEGAHAFWRWRGELLSTARVGRG